MPTAIRADLLTLTPEALRALLPYALIFTGVALTLILSVLKRPTSHSVILVVVMTTGLAAIASAKLLLAEPVALFGGGLTSDSMGAFFQILFAAAAAFTALLSHRYLQRESLEHPEYYTLILLSTLGMMVLASAQEILVLFLALELMSFSVYALVGFRRNDRRSNEAALKYLLLGAAASAVMLYGAALLYGTAHTLEMRGIWNAAVLDSSPMLTLGLWLFVAGLLFKVAAVPFHMWMPDVYEGAPTPVTGFMTTGVKVASFAALIRFFLAVGPQIAPPAVHLDTLLRLSAVLTLILGNLLAVGQKDVKRMLAYSSIAHTGYLLIGFVSGTQESAPAILLYLLTYSVMALGAFAILTVIGGPGDRKLSLSDLSGLAAERPGLAFSLAVFLFSLAGLPPTAGFVAKYFLLYGAVQAGEVPLVLVAVLCSLISVYYYLRVLVQIYMKPAGSDLSLLPRLSSGAVAVVAAMVILTLQIGLLPERWLTLMRLLPTP